MQDLSPPSSRPFKVTITFLIILLFVMVCAHGVYGEFPIQPAVLGGALVGIYFVFRGLGGEMHVRLDGETLLISDDRQEIKVPLSNLKCASCSRLMKPEVVTLTFKKPTQFGETVHFFPLLRLFGGYDDHPVVAMLNARAKAAAAAEVDSTAE